jgi:protein SCO1/2
LQETPSSTSGEYQVTHGAEVVPFGTDNLAHVIYTAGVSSQDYAKDLPKLLRQEAE